MSMTIATCERLTSVTITLHHPLDHYFALLLLAKKTEGLKPRTLNDHESHYRYLQRWLIEQYPALLQPLSLTSCLQAVCKTTKRGLQQRTLR